MVAIGNSTEDRSVIFGKNSDRPNDEIQLITYNPHTKYPKGEELKCTYISIPQVSETYAVILSQPWWMWGAEMGANEFGVVIGNEAVYTHEPMRLTGLLGMDLLRLGLERSKTAKEALNVMTKLLLDYGQGGGFAYRDPSWTYHNSFIIADPNEAYVLETTDNWWIAEKVKNVRSISNEISIRGKGDMRREGIIQMAIEKGYCKDDDDFDFASTFSGALPSDISSPYSRGGKSNLLLQKNKDHITPKIMMEFLREHESGICMHGGFESTGSQVSHLKTDKSRSIHWFTGSTLPCLSVYKPYSFPMDEQIVLSSGPYSKINEDWYWSTHSKFINSFYNYSTKSEKLKYINTLRAIEKELLNNVNNTLINNNEIDYKEFNNTIKSLNLKAWNQCIQLIK